MAQSQVVNGSFSCDDLLLYMGFFDEQARNELLETFGAETPDLSTMRAYLAHTEPLLFNAMSSLEGLNCAFALAVEHLREQYVQTTQLNKSLKHYQLAAEVTPLRKKSTKKTQKRFLETNQDAAFEPRKKETWCNKQEPWSDTFDVSEFYVVGLTRQCPVVEDWWRTMHHCGTKWEMEELCHTLTETGKKAICLKAYKVKAEFEMMRWKVVSNVEI